MHHEADICGLRCDYILVSLIKAVRCLGTAMNRAACSVYWRRKRGVVSATAVFVLLGLFNSWEAESRIELGDSLLSLLAIIVGIALWFLIKDKKEDV